MTRSSLVGQGGNAGTVVQFGGPSYYPFSPAAGGYPGLGGSRSKLPEWCNVSAWDLIIRSTRSPPCLHFSMGGRAGAAVRRKCSDGHLLRPGRACRKPRRLSGGLFPNRTCYGSGTIHAGSLGLGRSATGTVAAPSRLKLGFTSRHGMIFIMPCFFLSETKHHYCASTRLGSGPRRRQKMTRRGNRLRLNSLKRSPTLPVKKLIYQIV